MRNRLLILLLLLGMGIIVSWQAYTGEPSAFDIVVGQAVQQSSLPLLLGVMQLISWFGYPLGFIISHVTAISLLLRYQLKLPALVVALSTLEPLVSHAVKVLIHRPRPSIDLVMIYDKQASFGFPSGHVSHYVVFFGLLIYLTLRLPSIPHLVRRVSIGFCTTLIVLIGPSRMYLGAHWISDVIGGYLIGGIVLLACITLYEWLTRVKGEALRGKVWDKQQATDYGGTDRAD